MNIWVKTFFPITLLIITLSGAVQSSEITLSQLKQYAGALPEFPPMDNENPINPDYSSFFAAQKRTPIQRAADIFTVSTIFTDRNQVLQMLKRATDDINLRSQKHACDKDRIPIKTGDKILVWGDLHGAFHSLVRSLEELQSQGLINDELVIERKNVKFIFMGNIIDRSAYSLETLIVVLVLLHRNPDKVFYLRGSHENAENWQNYDFRDELRARLNVVDDNDPLIKDINHFFGLLPSKIFFKMSGEKPEYLVINGLYTTPTTDLLKIEPNITTLIKNQSRSRIYQTTNGLDLLPQEQGIPTWTVFSSPTLAFKNLYQFQSDAFAMIDIGTHLNASAISLVVKEIQAVDSNFKVQRFQLMSGEILKAGEFKKAEWFEVPIGCTLDLSESSRVLGARLRAGIDLKIRQINRTGGIRGKLLRIFFQNDKYNPAIAVRNIRTFIRDKGINIILSPLGVSATALLPSAEKQEILVLFPYSGVDVLRRSELSHLLHFRPSFAEEARALVQYSRETLLKQRFGIFYQDDAYGRSVLKAAVNKLESDYGIEKNQICSASYQRNTLEVSNAVKTLKQCNPDVLFLFSTLAPSEELVNKLGVSFLANITLMGVSFLTDRFRDFASGMSRGQKQGKGLNFIISRVVPNPATSDLQIVREYRQQISQEYPGTRYDADSLEGYIIASLLVNALTKLPLPITKQDIITEFEKLKSYDFKGLHLDFNPKTREFSKDVWLDTGKDVWLHM
ncbi:MAG: ABC transporter substrate-binding protein [Pseudomonadota bacterium]